MPSVAPSSSTDGFFQQMPKLAPLYISSNDSVTARHVAAQKASDDKVFARILALYIPENATEVYRSIDRLSRMALDPEILVHSVDADTNHPVLRPFTTFGEENRYDPLWTTAGWRALKDIGFQEGVTAVAYDLGNKTFNRRVHSFGLSHVWSCTATMTGCPMSMTDGAAKLLSAHLGDEDGDQPGFGGVIKEAYRRLTSTNPSEAWTSGQWMTERSGGSDVSGTETIARRLSAKELSAAKSKDGLDQDGLGLPLGPWQIDGFKWFSSATDSDMTLLLAQTGTGLSAFYVPLRRMSGLVSPTGKRLTESNGIRIQKLKNKLGTKSLPTAELELRGVRGWLVGTEGKGIKEIAAILNITRLTTAAGAAAGWARGLQICRAYSKVRKVRGGLLQDNPQHLRWMADETVKYWAAAHLSFFGHAMLGTTEQSWDSMVKNTKAAAILPESKSDLSALLRLLTPVMKAQVSVASVQGMRESMECLGGVGYCENHEDGGLLNIAKVFRDNLVNPIWEGTVSVMAEDVVRVLTDKRIGGGQVIVTVYTPWVKSALSVCRGRFESECTIVEERLASLTALVKHYGKEELLWCGREILNHLEFITCACLLMYDAVTDNNSVAIEIASRWTTSRVSPNNRGALESRRFDTESAMDRMIFMGAEATNTNPAMKGRL